MPDVGRGVVVVCLESGLWLEVGSRQRSRVGEGLPGVHWVVVAVDFGVVKSGGSAVCRASSGVIDLSKPCQPRASVRVELIMPQNTELCKMIRIE